MSRSLFLLLLLVTACSSAPHPQPVPRHPMPQPQTGPKAQPQPGIPIPIEAIDLLAESRLDSCSICAKELREKAFESLDLFYSPGLEVRSTVSERFLKGREAENRLMQTSYLGDDPGISFRFHTAGNHLVGVAEQDMTSDSLMRIYRSAPEGTLFQGALQIIAYPYGDGPTYLYSRSTHHLEVQCKILKISVDRSFR